jgi:hypothetical protein
MKELFSPGRLVRIISPDSLKEMDIIGIVTKVNDLSWLRDVWVPDLSREISFETGQLEIIND